MNDVPKKKKLPASGIVRRADTARNADRFNSSCFSYSCLTEFVFTFNVQVYFSGSTSLSKPEKHKS